MPLSSLSFLEMREELSKKGTKKKALAWSGVLGATSCDCKKSATSKHALKKALNFSSALRSNISATTLTLYFRFRVYDYL